MFGLTEKIFIGLSTGLVNGYNNTKWVSCSNQKFIIQPTLTINLRPNEYSQELLSYPSAVKLDVLKVLILLLTCLIRYVFQIKQAI